MRSADQRTLEDHLHRISSKLIFLRDHSEAIEAFPGLVDVVENLKDEAGMAIDLWEQYSEEKNKVPVAAG
ncbi:MAG: hypothetical protein ACP59X_04410 [Solidesulfovibrio sp. DCME]|uniref:hypothetical protein n=1 Tax=Solidesulfovibrio sp. DCME TaxID=3447380 RepID=UPI003D0B4796